MFVLLIMGLHSIFLKHRFSVHAVGIYPIVQMNTYDAVLVACGGILMFTGYINLTIFIYALLITMVFYFCIKRLFVIRAGALRSAQRMRIYDTAMFSWGAICTYAGIIIFSVFD